MKRWKVRKTQHLVCAVNIPQGSVRRQGLEMVYYQRPKFAKQVDNGALKEKTKNVEMKKSQEANILGSIIGSTKRSDNTL